MIWLKLLGLFGWLKKALTALLRLVRTYPLQAALIASLCLSGWLWRGRNEARADAATQQAGWINEIKLRKGDHARYRAAQVEAERLAREAKAKTEARYAELAREADNAKAETLRATADSFALSRRLRNGQPAAVGGPASGTFAAAEGSPAPDSDGPGPDAVLLTRPEYDQFVGNTLRLEAVRQWGQSLIEAGLAVPLTD